MEDNIFIAQLIGIYSVVTALSMFLKKKMLIDVFDKVFKTRTLSYVLGVMIFIIGLIMVLSFNSWSNGQRVVTSLVSWLVLIKGISYLFLSQKSLLKMLGWMHHKSIYYSIATGYLILGIYMLSVAIK